jgi:hypothetical protein
MRRPLLFASLLLTPLAAAGADEIDGLNSRAIDISSGFTPPTSGQYAAAFTSFGDDGRPDGITIQSRYTNPTAERGWIACTADVRLPPGAQRVSHPALSISGWLFVSANTSPNAELSDGWTLWATRRRPLMRPGSVPCDGWDSEWWDLGHFPGRPVASAPDSVVAYDSFTFAFVTDRNGYIDYVMLPPDAAPGGRRPEWRSLAAINPSVTRRYMAASKPAAAVYNESTVPNAGINRIHLFWHDSSHSQINHVRALVSPRGTLVEDAPDSRAFGDAIGATTATTACSAGPEIKAPGLLFVVCGNARAGTRQYSIARYSNPSLGWGNSGAVEIVGGRPWISRNPGGGYTAPSIGRTAIGGTPFMFVTFGTRYCPQPASSGSRERPAASCLMPPDRWAIQNRWSSLGNSLSGWERFNYETPQRAGPLE